MKIHFRLPVGPNGEGRWETIIDTKYVPRVGDAVAFCSSLEDDRYVEYAVRRVVWYPKAKRGEVNVLVALES